MMEDWIRRQAELAAQLTRDLPIDVRDGAMAAVLAHLLGHDVRQTRAPTSRKKPSERKTQASSRTRTRRGGPKFTLEALIDEGYFAEPRLMGDVINYVKSNNAIKYETSDVSPTLVRLVRERKLRRTRNATGQYEYVRA